MTTASSSGLASGPVPVRRAARSELVRWRRSSVAFAPLLGFAVATLQALFLWPSALRKDGQVSWLGT